MIRLPSHHFWPDSLSVHLAVAPLRRNIVGHRQITGAYLLGVAMHHRSKLATFDTGLSSLLPTRKLQQAHIEHL